MIIQPKCRGFICVTTHPVGCYKNVEDQINYVKKTGTFSGVGRVLVLGASTGYGLASRIVSAHAMGAHTIGVYFDKPGTESKTGSAGWYNVRSFDESAQRDGLFSKSINGDAFSDEVKEEVIQAIKEGMPDGKVDLIIYSLASPKRVDPETKQVYNSVIKPIEKTFEGKTMDFHSGVVSNVSITPAVQEEIDDTIAVMGGADWRLWMEALQKSGVLAENCITTAFSYIGPALTHAIYKDGTIGKAKLDLEKKAEEITQLLSGVGGKAFVTVAKALVTQASSAIPVVPLYISILYKIMKNKGLHEGCIEQMYRLFSERIYNTGAIPVDEMGRIRIDDLEMLPDVQNEVMEIWDKINSENISSLSDSEGYRKDFFNLFGFEREDVDYNADVQLT